MYLCMTILAVISIITVLNNSKKIIDNYEKSLKKQTKKNKKKGKKHHGK